MGRDRRGKSIPSYCSHCGEKLPQLSNFCPNCGTRIRESSRESDPITDRDVVEYRIEKALEEGWELEHDFGDRAVLVRRSLGGTAEHVLIFLLTFWWTMGLGNALYAMYAYWVNVERVVVYPDRVVEKSRGGGAIGAPSAGEGIPVAGYLSSGLFWLVAAAFASLALAIPSLAMAAFALLFTIIGLGTFPPLEKRLADRHSVTTNGWTRSVDERTIDGAEQPCASCYGSVGNGIERTYRKEFVVLGVPLTSTEGVNCYCRECANAESSPTNSRTDRQAVSKNESDFHEEFDLT